MYDDNSSFPQYCSSFMSETVLIRHLSETLISFKETGKSLQGVLLQYHEKRSA